MNALEFKRILFKTAFCCIACDGHIDEKEVREMQFINNKTSYFEDIDLSSELEDLIADLNTRGTKIIDNLFKSITEEELDLVQELLLLEVALRLIHSDERIDDNEVRFLRYLRSKLKVYDEVIMDRFGLVDLLFDQKYAGFFKTQDKQSELIEGISLPEYKELTTIDFSKLNAKK